MGEGLAGGVEGPRGPVSVPGPSWTEREEGAARRGERPVAWVGRPGRNREGFGRRRVLEVRPAGSRGREGAVQGRDADLGLGGGRGAKGRSWGLVG